MNCDIWFAICSRQTITACTTSCYKKAISLSDKWSISQSHPYNMKQFKTGKSGIHILQKPKEKNRKKEGEMEAT